jgi:hypothetical protein
MSDEAGSLLVLYDGKAYRNLSNLFEEFPDLLQSNDLSNKAAKIINFMLRGLTFDVVTDVDAFKNRYRSQIVKESTIHNNQTFLTRSYGVYDVTTMHAPSWDKGTMVFFAVNNSIRVPYKVTYQPPMEGHQGKCKYELLPQEKF